MRTVYIDDSTQGVKLGFRQEHDYTEIVYTLPSDWNGVVEAFIKKPGAVASVPLTGVTQTDGTASFTLTRTDLIEAGRGAIEYMCTMNGVVAKSKVFPVIIAADIISASTDRPDEWESWVDELTALAAQVRTDALGAAASATSASGSAADASQSASGAAQSAQSASESAGSAAQSAASASESAADAEEAKNTILGMRATATTLPEGSSATVDYNNGVMAFGIPRGDKGAKGDKGETGETGATPQMSIGTVETLEPDEDATATITGTAEAPVLNLGLPKGETGDVSLLELIANTKVDEVSDSVPYQMRTLSGVGSHESLRKIVGGTVAFNQLANPANETYTNNGVTFTKENGVVRTSGIATGLAQTTLNWPTFITNHVYGLWGCPSNGSSETYFFDTGANLGHDIGSGRIAKYTGETASKYLRVYVREGTDVNGLVFKPQLFNLTVMFGTTIADYIYSLEQATAGAGVAWFRKLFPKDYYEYNAGELLSVEGLESHDTVGFNQWDEEWENGTFSNQSGAEVTTTNAIRSKNYIPVLPNTQYHLESPVKLTIRYFDADKNFIDLYDANHIGDVSGTNKVRTTHSNCHYIRFATWNGCTAYHDDICINLSSPSRNGEYEEYVKHSYPLDNSLTLRGIPKLDSFNNLYYDGDEYESDGTVTRKYGVFTIVAENLRVAAGAPYENITYGRVFGIPNVMSSFTKNGFHAKFGMAQQTYPFDSASNIGKLGNNATANEFWFGFAKGTTIEQMQSILVGTTIVYELATPTTETATAYTELQEVESGGTEEFVGATIPVGHESVYPRTLADTMPTADGSYTLSLTVSGGKPSVEWEVSQ